MPISEIDKELAKLSKLKTEFNRKRRQYDDLQQDFQKYMESSLGKGQELLSFQERAGYTHIMNEMNQSSLWRKYDELLQKKDSGGLSRSDKIEFRKLQEKSYIQKLIKIRNQADYDQLFMDIQNIDELRKYMDGDIEWRRYKELSGVQSKSKNDVKELGLLSEQPDIKRMLAAEEGSKQQAARGAEKYPPYAPDSGLPSGSKEVGMTGKVKQNVRIKKYDIEMKAKYKLRAMNEYLEQREVVITKVLQASIAKKRNISSVTHEAINDLVNFVEAIDADLMTTDGTNGFSFDREISNAFISLSLFSEIQLESVVKAYSFRACVEGGLPLTPKELEQLRFIKIKPTSLNTLSTPEDFVRVKILASANRELLEMSPVMTALDAREDRLIAKISAREEGRLRALGKSEKEIKAQIQKIKESPIFTTADPDVQIMEKKRKLAEKQAELRTLVESKQEIAAQIKNIQESPVFLSEEERLRESREAMERLVEEKKTELLDLDQSEQRIEVAIEKIEKTPIFPRRKGSIKEQIASIKLMDVQIEEEPYRFITTEDDMLVDEWYVKMRKNDLKIEEMNLEFI